MNLLIVSETYPPEINGVARTLAQMVEGLAALSHAVTLVTPRQNGPATGTHSIEVEWHQVRGLPLPGYSGLQFGLPADRLLARLIADRSIEAAYIATEGPLGASALRACRRAGVPTLGGMHTNFHQYSQHYRAALLAPLVLRYLRRFHNRLDGTLVPTESMARLLRKDSFNDIHVWPRGVHADLFTPARRDPALRTRWGLDDNRLAVVYVGRLAPEKNIDLAFTAFEAILRHHPEARFIVVGDGPAADRLHRAHPDAIFTGPKTGTELARHYASGDIFLFPSKTETFGNVTLEAMASGLALIAFDLAAAHALVEHRHNGLLADADAESAFITLAAECARDIELRSTLKRHARETALQHSWPRLIVKLEALLLDISRENPTDGRKDLVQSAKRA